MILSKYRVVAPAFDDHQDGIRKRLVFGTRTATQRVIDARTWDRLEAGDLAAVDAAIVRDLVDAELLVPDDEDELRTVLARNQAAVSDEDVFWLVIEPTALCQLGCGYCGQQHTPQLLSAEDQERLIDRVRGRLQSKSYRVLRASWFGAEPLLGLDVIRALAPRLQALAKEFGCGYRSLMVTNGLDLSSAVAAELVQQLRIAEFQITLDGAAEWHDTRRPTRGGGGTFQRIFENLVALARRDDLEVAVILRCNVDRRNVQGVSPLIQSLAREGFLTRIDDFSFSPVHDWGNEAGKLALPKQEFAALEMGWLAELIAGGFTPRRLVPARREINCMAVTPNSLLVDPYGQLYNCTEASLVPAPPGRPPSTGPAAFELPILSTAETYAIGDLQRGEQSQRRQLLGDFSQRVAAGEYPCHDCRMLPVCGGACPKHWREGNEPCPSTKFNIEQRLLLNYALSRLAASA